MDAWIISVFSDRIANPLRAAVCARLRTGPIGAAAVMYGVASVTRICMIVTTMSWAVITGLVPGDWIVTHPWFLLTAAAALFLMFVVMPVQTVFGFWIVSKGKQANLSEVVAEFNAKQPQDGWVAFQVMFGVLTAGLTAACPVFVILGVPVWNMAPPLVLACDCFAEACSLLLMRHPRVRSLIASSLPTE